MAKKIRIAVLYGGVSGEHEISVISAKSVIAALSPKKYDVIPIRISKKGEWTVERLRQKVTLKPGNPGAFLAAGKPLGVDVVFPLVHGTYGEDGTLQGLLELVGIPYVGSGVLGSAVGMDKIMQKKVLAREGFPVPRFLSCTSTEWDRDASSIIAVIEKRLGYPCFVKPANLGSSVGITKAHHRNELRRAIVLAASYDRRIIVEKAVVNAREIECAVLGNDALETSVLGEIVSSNEFYDYAAKYLDGKSKAIVPAALPKTTAEKIRAMAARAFVALDACGFARVDFLVDRKTNDIFLNEINTIPGFTSISMFPKLWEASGMPYPKLLDALVSLARDRAAAGKRLRRSYTP